MAVSPSSFAKLAAKGNESVKDFVWTSISQITLPASSIEINGSLYSAGDLVFDFANGTGDNGLDTGTETANQWYALYAVPGSGTAYKLKASVNLPAELGGSGPTGFSNYRYLGLFRNGHGPAANNTSDIVRFIKSGADMRFTSRPSGTNVAISYLTGVIIATQTPGNGVTYTGTFGMGSTDLPFGKAQYTFSGSGVRTISPPAERFTLRSTLGGSTIEWSGLSGFDSGGTGGSLTCGIDSSVAVTLALSWSGVSPNVDHAISVAGFIDPALNRRKM